MESAQRATSGPRAVWVRIGLVFFTLVTAVLGTYVLVSPAGFFSHPWVNLGMAYNPHLMLDYGAMNLAATIPLGAAAVTMNPILVRVALASYAVWSSAHFLIHLHLRPHMAMHSSASETDVLLAVLAVGAAVSILFFLLALGRLRAGPESSQPPTSR